MIQRTLVLLKPDAVKRAISGEILQRFEKVGLKICGLKMTQIDKDFSKKHYSVHVEKHFYPWIEDYITSGPVIAICLEGINAVSVVRKMAGSTAPNEALPGTIRGDFAHLSTEWVNKKEIGMPNIVHASDSLETAEKELDLWFTKEELHNYKTAHEEFVF